MTAATPGLERQDDADASRGPCRVRLVGRRATQVLLLGLPVGEAFRWDDLDGFWLAVGGIAGALLGHLGWVAANPRQQLSRAATVCALANMAVWCAFVALTPPIDDAECQRIAAERQQRDAECGAIDFIHDAPTIVAGRWHGTFGAVNGPDRLLSIFDVGAIGFAQLVILSPRYFGIDATRGESFAVAGIAFILSTAFYVAVGGATTALRRRYRVPSPAPLPR